MTKWLRARMTVLVEVRPATPEDEWMIRRREGEALKALGVNEDLPVYPDYYVMRGPKGEEYPIARTVFNETYEIVDWGDW